MFEALDSASVAVGMMIGTFLTALVIDWHNEGVEGRDEQLRDALAEIERLKGGAHDATGV